MKYLRFIAVLAVLWSCKEQKETVKTAELPEQKPKEWISYEGKSAEAKHIVLVSGDEEYRSEEALPQLAKILSQRHGFQCTVLFAQVPGKPGIIDPNFTGNIPGLAHLDKADLMVIFTRFRALPDEQMKHFDDYLMAGKPLVAIRTATHAFNFADSIPSNYHHYGNYYKGDKEVWKDGFGRLVLGENWVAHHGHHKHQSTRGLIADKENTHPITTGIKDGDIWGSTDVYEVRLPLPGDSEPIILGQVINREGEFDEEDLFFGMKPTDSEVAKVNNKDITVNETLMPIAWTKSYQLPDGTKGKAFTSTIGSSSDLLNEGTRRLLVNAVYWGLDMPVPEAGDVALVGEYKPSAYSFQTDEYWQEKQPKISDFE
ncbi:MAG: ThuA domain-containing protein [Bacteroidota bacterium]